MITVETIQSLSFIRHFSLASSDNFFLVVLKKASLAAYRDQSSRFVRVDRTSIHVL